MELNIAERNGSLIIEIIGAVDNESAEELKNNFQEIIEQDFDEAVFNLELVPFITSSGIGKILVFYKNTVSRGKNMRVKGISENLFELFKSIKLDKLFPIEK
ncbi:MAG: STAS domain-containing protein [bacterium]|nr:MAG: STAS domain-containing protein [bacterium]